MLSHCQQWHTHFTSTFWLHPKKSVSSPCWSWTCKQEQTRWRAYNNKVCCVRHHFTCTFVSADGIISLWCFSNHILTQELPSCARLLRLPICPATDIIHLINTCSDGNHSAPTNIWALYNSAHPWIKDAPTVSGFPYTYSQSAPGKRNSQNDSG